MSIVTQSCHAPSNDERRAAWAARYYGSGLHRCGMDGQQQQAIYDDRPSLRIDHGEDDPIPFELDGAWTKVAEITRNTLKHRVAKLNEESK